MRRPEATGQRITKKRPYPRGACAWSIVPRCARTIMLRPVKRAAPERSSDSVAELLKLCERVHDTLPDFGGVRNLGSRPTDAVMTDFSKTEGMHDEWCCNCKRADLFLFKCQAENCYASFCPTCSVKSKSVIHNNMFICGMCMGVQQPIGDSFDISGKSTTNNKVDANFAFFFWVNFLHVYAGTSCSKNILVLDGENGQTSSWFLSEISTPLKVFVPNPDKDICIKLSRMGVTAIPIRVGGFLTNTRNDESFRFSAAWMDYCGSYDGSTTSKVYPRQDLWKLWFSGFDKNGDALLFLTISMRGKVLTSVDQIQAEQIQTASLYGWTARCVPARRYGQMALLGFVARHVNFRG